MNLLDGIVNTILGPDTSQMSDADRQKADAQGDDKRKEAQAYAFNASNNPGKQFMRPETSVGVGDERIEKLIKMIFSGGGGGGG